MSTSGSRVLSTTLALISRNKPRNTTNSKEKQGHQQAAPLSKNKNFLLRNPTSQKWPLSQPSPNFSIWQLKQLTSSSISRSHPRDNNLLASLKKKDWSPVNTKLSTKQQLQRLTSTCSFIKCLFERMHFIINFTAFLQIQRE